MDALSPIVRWTLPVPNALILVPVLLAGARTTTQEAGGVAPSLPSRAIAESGSRVTHLVSDPRRSVIYTATEKGTIAAWDPKKAAALWATTKEVPGITGLAAGGDFVVFTLSGLGAVFVLEAETGQAQTGVGGTAVAAKATCVVSDVRDRWVWVGTEEGVLQRLVVGNVQGWSNRSLKNGGILALALEPEGDLLAVAGRDKTIRLANAASASVDDKKVLAGHTAAITAIAVAPKASVLVSGAEDHTVRVWSVASGKCKFQLDAHLATIRGIAIDPKGARCASGDEQGVTKLWNLAKGEELATLKLEASGPVAALVFLDKGKTLAVAAGGTCVTLWDLSQL